MLHTLCLICLSLLAHALPKNHTDYLTNAAIDNGTFSNPSVNVRPKFRYRIPDADVNHSVLADDIYQAGRVGAAGVEVLGYYLYGGTPQGTGDYAPDDWSVYGWGLEAWKGVVSTIAQATKKCGLIMDFAMGPNQGQGVPMQEDDEGRMYDLRSYNVSVPIGGSWNGTIPGWDTVYDGVKLLAVVTALVTESKNVTVPEFTLQIVNPGTYPALPNDVPLNRTQATLSKESLTDITDQVGSDGSLSVSFPNNSTGLHYEIFFVWLIHASYRAQNDPAFIMGPQTDPQTWRQNGSWAVDHYSAAGARTLTRYWEQYLIPNGSDLKQLMQEVGNYGWEDSIETRAEGAFFTYNFTEVFQSDHGYDLSIYLPIIMHQNTHGTDNYYYVWWITDEDDFGNGHIADYRQTLTNLYGVYLDTLEAWAQDYLDVQFSAQVSYNLPGDMLQNVPDIGGSECESLGFYHLIDAYRQYTGPANLAQHRLVSTECGANYGDAYMQTFPEYLWDVKRSIAGSVVQFIIHGFPYSGLYGNTTWPGFTTFDYAFSEMAGPRNPGWEFQKEGMVDFIARHSFIFQSGIPKRDVAFYQFWTTYPYVPRNYQPRDLEEAGYSYEYLSPNNFDLPQAVVENGVLGPDAQEFKALIIRGNDSISVAGAEGIARFAHAGLPIIASGGFPTYLASANESGAVYAQQTLESLKSLPNVHIVPYEELESVVASLGISPLTAVTANNTWYTYWRQTSDFNYVFVYNDALAPNTQGIGNGYSQGSVEFASIGKPYFLDAWSGVEVPIANYTQTANTTTVPLQLAGNQSVIIAFDLSQKESNHTIPSSFDVLDPSQWYPPASATKTIDLDSWTLIVEHWDPPGDLSKMLPSDTVKYNTTHQISNGLQAWKDLDVSLHNTSGIGYYNTSFELTNPTNSTQGAIVDFGPIFYSIRATVNGHVLSPLDLTWARADISRYLVEGENTVEAVVATPLFNAIRPIWNDLLSSAGGPTVDNSEAPLQDYGLVSPVSVILYRR